MRMRVKVDLAEFKKNGVVIQKAVNQVLSAIGKELKTEVKSNARRRSGQLARSIRILKKTTRRIRVGTTLIYGPIHEFGGTIRPNKGKYMRFKIGDRWVTLRGVTIKPDKYFREARKDIDPQIPQISRKVMKEHGL